MRWAVPQTGSSGRSSLGAKTRDTKSAARPAAVTIIVDPGTWSARAKSRADAANGFFVLKHRDRAEVRLQALEYRHVPQRLVEIVDALDARHGRSGEVECNAVAVPLDNHLASYRAVEAQPVTPGVNIMESHIRGGERGVPDVARLAALF